MIYHRKKDLSEFLIDEDSNEDYSTTLNDFIFMLKTKHSYPLILILIGFEEFNYKSCNLCSLIRRSEE